MKTAMITGVSSGIGQATARKFLEEGYSVIGLSRRIPEEFDGTYAGEFTHVQGDLGESESRKRYVDTAMEKYGKIDVLVNVAGVAPKIRADLLEMTEESYDYVMNINTKGTLFLTQMVANKMKQNPGKQKGCIVNISSMSAYTSSTNRGEYCISKAGVTMITKLFADRLAEYGIPVNEIRPGIIATGMTEKVLTKYQALIEDAFCRSGIWGSRRILLQQSGHSVMIRFPI